MSRELIQPLKDKIRLSASRRKEALAILAKDKSNKKQQVSAAEFAELLFKRAPDNFLLKQTPNTLVGTAQETHQFYLDYVSGKESSLVKVYNPSAKERSKVTVLVSAISDRPFIVDTISEFLRVSNLQTSVFLHPILSSADEKLTSVSYIELERIDDQDTLKQIEEELQQIFSDLILATDDFRTIRGRVQEISKEFSKAKIEVKDSECTEVGATLEWLADGGFVFLGLQKSSLVKGSLKTQENLGLFSSENPEYTQALANLSKEASLLFKTEQLLRFIKFPLTCSVHRRAFMEVVYFRLPGSKEVYTLIGLLTSRSIAQEASSVPVIRKKLAVTIENEGVLKNSHDYKEIVSLVDSMPKSELFQASSQDLSSLIAVTLDVHQHASTRVYLQSNEHSHFAYLVVVLVRRRFTMGARSRIQKIIAKEFKVPFELIEHRLAITDDPLVRIHYAIPLTGVKKEEIDLADLESRVATMSLTWDDRLRIQLRDYGSRETEFTQELPLLIPFYQQSFPPDFKASRSTEEALNDIIHLQKISLDNPIEASLEPFSEQEEDLLELRLYKDGGIIPLSKIVPLLEHTGFSVLSEKVTKVPSLFSEHTSIYSFKIASIQCSREQVMKARQTFLSGLKSILRSEADDDILNELLINPGLNMQDITILRALQRYLWQLKVFASERVIARALVKHPPLALLLADYFHTKFDPNLGKTSPSLSDRKKALLKIKKSFKQQLKNVPRLTHDRALRALLNIVDAAVRTNAFSTKDSGRVAIKIRCSEIENMPSPRPFFETYVNSPRMEGVHLRGGMVSRGGLRWSERSEDYRTEILGLMKTQKVKNAIIIPVGAKGGFVLKKRTSDRVELAKLVKAAYKEFITSLLELADNRQGDSIEQPKNMLIYDSEDPYLVVAADKGTATFSDTANSISRADFSFWLDDAFASGGSNGYDHKKLGITARGAWEAVIHHFRSAGIDPAKDCFSCVGIGDMSGDVFGNGLLRSNKTKLIAAFNHKHIFLDPNPKPEESFAERERMFLLPRSDWTDYNSELISKGGGIFDRSSKEIEISPEVQAALGIKEKVLSGDALIKASLCAPVDLIWNGGIGTYVRHEQESNLEVGDPSNDDVRIAATELRAKVIGEGGNLGLTQRARIQYSGHGGLINTDAVDNSGGVDLSDQEVNFKILLQQPLSNKDLSWEERNKVLEKFAQEFCERVLYHNRSQCAAISLIEQDSKTYLTDYSDFITFLEATRGLDRSGEALPSEESLEQRKALGTGLTRPEGSVVLAYSKMWVYESLLTSDLPDQDFLDRFLFSYFPEEVVQKYSKYISSHPLRREIISTEVANCFTDLMGPTFLRRVCSTSSCDPEIPLAAFLVVMELVQGRKMMQELNALTSPQSLEAQLFSIKYLQKLVARSINWFISEELLGSGPEQAWSTAKDWLTSFDKTDQNKLAQFSAVAKLDKKLKSFKLQPGIHNLLCLAELKLSSLDAAFTAKESGADLENVREVFSFFKEKLLLEIINDESNFMAAESLHGLFARRKLQNDYRKKIRAVAAKLLKSGTISDIASAKKFFKTKTTELEQLESIFGGQAKEKIGTGEVYLALNILNQF